MIATSKRLCFIIVVLGIVTGSSALAHAAVVQPPKVIPVDQVGLYKSDSTFRLARRSGATSYWTNIRYGVPGDQPLIGDWNGDGLDTLGVKRGNTYRLRNSNTGGPADIKFSYGRATDVPVVGDWNGDGVDTIAVRRGAVWLVRNSLTSGPAQVRFSYGRPGDLPVAGDWNGDAVEHPGIFRHDDTNWFIATGSAPIAVAAYRPGDQPFVGDWNADGKTTFGIRRAAIGILRNEMSQSAPVVVSLLDGSPLTSVPIVGHWLPAEAPAG
jgi:hypothetical protein